MSGEETRSTHFPETHGLSRYGSFGKYLRRSFLIVAHAGNLLHDVIIIMTSLMTRRSICWRNAQLGLISLEISLRESVPRLVFQFRFWFSPRSGARVHGVQLLPSARRWWDDERRRRDGIENVTLPLLPTSGETSDPGGGRASPIILRSGLRVTTLGKERNVEMVLVGKSQTGSVIIHKKSWQLIPSLRFRKCNTWTIYTNYRRLERRRNAVFNLPFILGTSRQCHFGSKWIMIVARSALNRSISFFYFYIFRANWYIRSVFDQDEEYQHGIFDLPETTNVQKGLKRPNLLSLFERSDLVFDTIAPVKIT